MVDLGWRKEPLTEQNEFIEVLWKCGADGRTRSCLMQLNSSNEFYLAYRSMDKIELTGTHKYTGYWNVETKARSNEPTFFWWRPRKDPTQELLELEQQGSKKE